tara:strand:- start:207 stop:611 length:405 start_codon:yes stop_codon:yes gene_type:complete
MNRKYPFEEGDDYWVIQKGKIIKSCWDDVSEKMFDNEEGIVRAVYINPIKNRLDYVTLDDVLYFDCESSAKKAYIYLMENIYLKHLEDCKDLLVDINFLMDRNHPLKSKTEMQVIHLRQLFNEVEKETPLGIGS